MKHHFFALSLTLLASPFAINAADTNSLAALVRRADLVAHVQAIEVERDPNMTAALTFRCSATCIVKETLKGASRRQKISVSFMTRQDPVFAAGNDYIAFLGKDGTTNQLGQEGFRLSYPREDAQGKEVRPYSRALWDEIRTNALLTSKSSRSEHDGPQLAVKVQAAGGAAALQAECAGFIRIFEEAKSKEWSFASMAWTPRDTNFPPAIASFGPEVISVTRQDGMLLVDVRVAGDHGLLVASSPTPAGFKPHMWSWPVWQITNGVWEYHE